MPVKDRSDRQIQFVRAKMFHDFQGNKSTVKKCAKDIVHASLLNIDMDEELKDFPDLTEQEVVELKKQVNLVVHRIVKNWTNPWRRKNVSLSGAK